MSLLLFDLLAPQFLLGVRLKPKIHNMLSFLTVTELDTVWDEFGILYTGKVSYKSDGSLSALPRLSSASDPDEDEDGTTSFFEWGSEMAFRLTVPRNGSSTLKTAVDSLTAISAQVGATELAETLDRLGSVPAVVAPSDYPSFGFKLELLIDTITLHLPRAKFFPAKLTPDGWLEIDKAFQDVSIELPKIALVISQPSDDLGVPDFEFAAWGITSLDDNLDPRAGEAIRMIPPLCLHKSGVFGFGLEKVVLDFSKDSTPPDLLEKFGIGDDFTGLWLPKVRVFFGMGAEQGLAFHVAATDLVYDFQNHDISGEFEVEVIREQGELKVQPVLTSGEIAGFYAQGDVKKADDDPKHTIVKNSLGSVTADGRLLLHITGGQPPYTIAVRFRDGETINAEEVDGKPNILFWPLGRSDPSEEILDILVFDGSHPESTWDEGIQLSLLALTTVSTGTTRSINVTERDGTPGYHLNGSIDQPDPNFVRLVAVPGTLETVTLEDGTSLDVVDGREVLVPVTNATTITVNAEWKAEPPPGQPAPIIVSFRFIWEHPLTDADIPAEVDNIIAAKRADIRALIERADGKSIQITGRASQFAGDETRPQTNKEISERRAEAMRRAILQVKDEEHLPQAFEFADLIANGFQDAVDAGALKDKSFQNAVAIVPDPNPLPTPKPFRQADVLRETTEGHATIPTTGNPSPNPIKPGAFRSVKFRVRLERGVLVLAEISGEVDMAALGKNAVKTIDADADDPLVETSPDASVSNQPGVVDVKLLGTYDTATDRLTITLTVGAGETNTDGLFFLLPPVADNTNPSDTPNQTVRTILGLLMIFAPFLAGAAESAVDAASAESGAGAKVALSAAVLLPAAIALNKLDAFSIQQATFFGAELSATIIRNRPVRFDEAAVLFDYGVDFTVDIDKGPIKIQSKDEDGNPKPLRVRYEAIGVRLVREADNQFHFDFVFDTSRGFEFDLADPGIINVAPPLGDILQVVGARVAKINPQVVELDLGITANLGVISVERLRITVPIDDPNQSITLQPTGVGINVPGTLSASGYLDLEDGIKGSLDVTLIPAKLRLAAKMALEHLDAPPRTVTAALVTLAVQFGSPIPLFGTGLGLYGLMGLFAMHYKRDEATGTVLPPALDWLNTRAQGDPTKLSAWKAELDRWSFGVGVVVGSMEGGKLFNMKGMLVVELPGPRILIFVKAQVLHDRPPTRGTVDTLGVLAVVDLDFNLGKLSIGALIAQKIDPLISLQVPAEAAFDFNDVRKWHANLGSITHPASAKILSIHRAQGYLMFAGDEIAEFPAPEGPITLPGLAVALGIRASVLLGDVQSKLYLRASAQLDAGVTFSPFHIFGTLELRGDLNLYIVSIAASASLSVTAPDPTVIKGEVCGKVELLFFSVEGCINISTGSGEPALPAPDLVRAMSLQSRSPALVQGQGTDVPIDGALAEAIPTGSADELPVVPIDAVPVLHFQNAPGIGQGFSTFTQTVDMPTTRLLDGWIDQGGGHFVRYDLLALEIVPPLAPDPTLGKPPAAWRPLGKQAQGNDTSIDLALFSWEPDPAPHAMQRSPELTDRLGAALDGICDKIAPPAPILWAFHEQRLGTMPTPSGWLVRGIAQPGPSGTHRRTQPDTQLRVRDPNRASVLSPLSDAFKNLLGQQNLDLARIIGFDPGDPDAAASHRSLTGRVLQLPYLHAATVVNPATGLGLTGEQITALSQYLSASDLAPQRVVIGGGEVIHSVKMLIGATARMTAARKIVLRARDANDHLLQEVVLNSVMTRVTSSSNLPVSWTDTTSPWRAPVDNALQCMRELYPGHEQLFVDWTPPAGTLRFEVVCLDPQNTIGVSVVLIGVIELLRDDEVRRAAQDQEAQHSQQNTVAGAFNAGNLRPLLAPNTTYTIRVRYNAQTRQQRPEGQGTGFDEDTPEERTQAFQFKTDAQAPTRLDPWILATTPHADDPLHFVNDPVQIIFNDASAVQLFETYGKSLRAVLRKASGDHPDQQPPLTKAALKPIKGTVLTPFEDTLRQVIKQSDEQCITPPDSHHALFDLSDVPLERATAYTLSVETGDPPPNATAPRRPLFRTAFRTSRFLGIEELAAFIRSSSTLHRPLRANLPTLPAITSQNDFENALIAALSTPIPPAATGTIMFLWGSAQGGQTEPLLALLVDSPEPMWRSRLEPALVTETGENGPMDHWVQRPYLYLELAEDTEPAGTGTSAAPAVQQFIRTESGTRTLIMLRPGAQTLKLVLRQHPHSLVDDGSNTQAAIYDLALPVTPPWRS